VLAGAADDYAVGSSHSDECTQPNRCSL
jgi:hypothetical protein